ncbi:MAG TPA: beta-propeller fold lactonase family protein [Xanthobacteraceae bacterium]|nr:beta-propeller fold lactonase family protein [Xanthobacteraceae bacterium]
MSKTVFYASVGPALTLYDLDIDGAALSKHSAITLPANVQYLWPHPSRRYLYVVSSTGGPGIAGDAHFASALLVDPTTGALKLHGEPARLPSRPIHTAVDATGEFLLSAFNIPSNITVHRIKGDGTIGPLVQQSEKLDTGIFAHQVRMTPSNRAAVLVTRGNNAEDGKVEDPGAIKTYSFNNGVLKNLASIAPGNAADLGLGFGPRHLDFHPTEPWAFVSIERQNKLCMYKLDGRTGLAREPSFIKETLADPHGKTEQGAGAIHVHPNGRFVYLTNRSFPASPSGGRKMSAGGENSVAVYALDGKSGEPSHIQSIDGHGVQLRTFSIDPDGRILVAASILPVPRPDGTTVTAGLTVFRMGPDGKLTFARKYDVDVGNFQQFWTGMITLP